MPRIRFRFAWLPPIILGILVFTWLGSLLGAVTIAVPCQKGGYLFWFVGGGSCGVFWLYPPFGAKTFEVFLRDEFPRVADLTGCFYVEFETDGQFPITVDKVIPLPWLMAVVLPLVVGTRTRFRFSMRMCLAWLALVAFLLAMTTYERYPP